MALPCTGFVASAFNSAPGVTDIEGWGDNSNNFYQQSLIWGCALARRLVPSLCLPSSPSLAAPVDHASHQRKCKPSVFPQCRSDCSTSGKTATSCLRTTKLFRCGLGDKWESQKLGAQISGSPLTAMLHFDCQPRNKKQTDILGGAKAIAAACLRFRGFSGLCCCWSSVFRKGELVGWQQT